MDKYTKETKDWLEERFRKCDGDGVYYAHQPIYGFRKGHSEPGFVSRHVITYNIMEALSHLRFDSLLDVGAAEGYKAYVAKTLLNVSPKCCDLSEEACKRAEEIFNIESRPADIQSLPFTTNEFDVVLCSETLEHVSDLRMAIDELLRVASKAVVITVPHESKEVTDKNVKEAIPHAHIWSFSLQSFDFLKSRGYQIIGKRVSSPLLRIPSVLVEAMPGEYNSNTRYPKTVINLYNICVPILRRLFGKRTAAFLIRLDDFICKFMSSYDAISFIILKDGSAYNRERTLNISPKMIFDVTVPYRHIAQKK